MQNLKKLLITTLSLAMFASLAGCDSTEKAPDYQKIENQFTSSFKDTDATFEPLKITDELKILANEYAYSVSLSSILYNGDLNSYTDRSNEIYDMPIGKILQQIVSSPAYNDDNSMSAEDVRAAMLDLYYTENEPTYTHQEFNTLLTYKDGIYTLFDGDVAKIYEDLGYYYEEEVSIKNCYYNLTEVKWSEYEDGVLSARFDVYDISHSKVQTAVADQNFEVLNHIAPEKIIYVDFKLDFGNGQTKINYCGYSGADPLDYIVPIEIGLAEKDFVKAVQASDDEQIVDKFNDYARQNMLCYVPNFDNCDQLIQAENLGMAQMQALFIKHYQNRYMNHSDITSILTTDEMESLVQDLYYAKNYPQITHHSYSREVIFENDSYLLLPGGTPYFNYEFYVLNDYEYTDNVFTTNYNRYYFDEYYPEEVEIAEALNNTAIKVEDFANCEPYATCTTKLFIDEETGQAKVMSNNEIFNY